MRREDMKKGVFFGLIGNLMFILFGLVCIPFYYTYSAGSFHSRLLETLAYAIELGGFGLLIYSDYLLSVSVRFRKIFKVSYTAYIILEAIMMILELNTPKMPFYAPYSLVLAIVHSVLSGAALFAFLQLDPDNKKYEIVIIACVSVVFAGMMGKLLGIRVYFSIIANALGMAMLFGGIKFLDDREDIEIDCYGDRARVAEYNSLLMDEAEPYRKKKAEKEAKAEEAPVSEEETSAETEAEQVQEEKHTPFDEMDIFRSFAGTDSADEERTEDPAFIREPVPEPEPEPEAKKSSAGSRNENRGNKKKSGRKKK